VKYSTQSSTQTGSKISLNINPGQEKEQQTTVEWQYGKDVLWTVSNKFDTVLFSAKNDTGISPSTCTVLTAEVQMVSPWLTDDIGDMSEAVIGDNGTLTPVFSDVITGAQSNSSATCWRLYEASSTASFNDV